MARVVTQLLGDAHEAAATGGLEPVADRIGCCDDRGAELFACGRTCVDGGASCDQQCCDSGAFASFAWLGKVVSRKRVAGAFGGVELVGFAVSAGDAVRSFGLDDTLVAFGEEP